MLACLLVGYVWWWLCAATYAPHLKNSIHKHALNADTSAALATLCSSNKNKKSNIVMTKHKNENKEKEVEEEKQKLFGMK